jgi:hypothetical protein
MFVGDTNCGFSKAIKGIKPMGRQMELFGFKFTETIGKKERNDI